MADIKVAFGMAVRRLRTERGFSQENFAAKAKINRSYMGRIERGTVNISLDNIQRISKALTLSVGQLMMEVDADAAKR
jgi:transcriptional regulator with XRE-family HTH domain